jgi:hypothetical protein
MKNGENLTVVSPGNFTHIDALLLIGHGDEYGIVIQS